jgi:hypothetical protein
MPVIFSICFIVQLKITQHEAKEKLEQSMLQTVHLKKEEFSWYKKGKEIRIGKHLFDVKSIKEENCLFIITGLYDVQEDELNELLEKMENKQKNSSHNKLCGFFFHAYYSIPSSQITEPLATEIKNDFPAFYLAALLSPAKKITSPPPNVV